MKYKKTFGLGILKGLTVTLKNYFRPPITLQYPEEKLNISRRTRGNELIWQLERCTGCATCAKSCPQGNIEIVTHAGLEESRYIVDKFEVDTGRCMMCGLCVEACPYDALYMGRNYECTSYRRRDLIQNKDTIMMSPARMPSGYFHPKYAALWPKQKLLINWDKEEGQKLAWFPWRKKAKKVKKNKKEA